jgi:chloramphenicol 3-O phosphotransferase
VATQVIFLNGGSSSGKTGIVRCLQAVLPQPWLALSVDTFVGAGFMTLEAAWMEGVAAMARAGARVILDDVFLGGADSQRRWQKALDGLDVLWVGVRCAPEVVAGRELARGDRAVGMAEGQAESVHRGVHYDLEIDTARTESLDCARTIAAKVG